MRYHLILASRNIYFVKEASLTCTWNSSSLRKVPILFHLLPEPETHAKISVNSASLYLSLCFTCPIII